MNGSENMKCIMIGICKHTKKCFVATYVVVPVPVAARSKAWFCGRSPAEIMGSNPTGAWMSVCCDCCVMSGRGLWDEPITRPEESY